MELEVIAGSLPEIVCDSIIIHVSEGAMIPGGTTGAVDKALSGHISEIIRDMPECGKYGETTVIHTFGAIGAKHVILLGLGKQSELTLDKARALIAVGMRAARKLRAKTVVTTVPDTGVAEGCQTAQAVVEGAVMGLYRFKHYKTGKEDSPAIEKLVIAIQDGTKIDEYNEAMRLGKIIAESVNYARDLVNHPAQYMTPAKMAWHAAEIAQKYGLELSVLDKEDMEKQGMGALLAVAQGSVAAPKLIALKYAGAPAKPEVIAYVGKGITFDSGGISLKPSQNMDEMKGDMAGGGAVLGAMLAIAQIKPKINILAVVPCTENMPYGTANRPGDIITSMSGKTIEVLNTDAEGRLILADAITYAQKLGATKLIDIATLTGACVVGLGSFYSGVITNNREWLAAVTTAAWQTGEKMWELPNDEAYLEQIKSSIADLKNSGGRPGGAITAGLFIGQFAGETPWVHVDIAGTSDTDKNKGYNLKGGTGAGVRTLIQLAANLGRL